MRPEDPDVENGIVCDRDTSAPPSAQKDDLVVGTFWAAAIPQTRVERFGGICDPIFDERMSRTDGVVDLSMDPFWPFRSECSSEVGENETSYYAKDVVEH